METNHCTLCPRVCGVDRRHARGYCGCDDRMTVSGIMLHHWEEPCVSGHAEKGAGSGAIFFGGCPLHCVFCQNAGISHRATGDVLTPRALADEMLRLQEKGAYNINLVSPTQYTDGILRALELCRPALTVPVLWNTGGYERPETIRRLSGLVDVFLTDFKYGTAKTGQKYAAAPDYPETAAAALRVMREITGTPLFDSFPDGLRPVGRRFTGRLRRGVLLRHLLLPGERQDSMAVLRLVAATVPPSELLLSLMRQYTPPAALPDDPALRNLRRRVTSFEFDSVASLADSLGFDGYGQQLASADGRFTPAFAR